MNKEEIKALLAIIRRQSFVGVNREAIENNLEYRLLCSAATKLEKMLLDIESGYNKLVNAENARKGAEMSEEAKDKVWACIEFTLANAELDAREYRQLTTIKQIYFS